jgi:putative Mg2+ transporter-C (MgtC) family protein
MFGPELILFGKLLLATFLGMLVGIERVSARKSAGGRTFALVSLGACLFVMLGELVNVQYLGIVNFDPMRIAASAVMGVGFIGGGLIFLQGKSLQGLTTAAGLWVAAGVGMAVGFNFYAIAVFTSILTLVIFTFLWVVEDWFKRFFARMQPVTVEGVEEDTDEDSVPDSEEKYPI